ncbi:MAG: hypothetical protein QNJ46_20025, partial [Leptolyngbyaceae cyanobacterium MO_188.B28]|nr:hypothetical protein [Leptolyngbyaceae cyanobacterium MO_188.B28]
ISSLRPDFGADSNLYVDYVPYRLLSAVFENLHYDLLNSSIEISLRIRFMKFYADQNHFNY